MSEITVKTSKFGEVKIDTDGIFLFPQGISGFENEKKFAVINTGQNNFMWLLSVENPDVSLLVTEPSWFMPSYSDRVLKEDLIYRIKKDEHRVICGCYYDRAKRKVFANILAPFLLDLNTKTGRQIILSGSERDLEFDIIEEIKKNSVNMAV